LTGLLRPPAVETLGYSRSVPSGRPGSSMKQTEMRRGGFPPVHFWLYFRKI
jgi:hypothetical protein